MYRAHHQRVAMFALSAIPPRSPRRCTHSRNTMSSRTGGGKPKRFRPSSPSFWEAGTAGGPLIGAAIVTFLPNHLNLHPTPSHPVADGLRRSAHCHDHPGSRGRRGWRGKLTASTAARARNFQEAATAEGPAETAEAVGQTVESRRRVAISAVSKRTRDSRVLGTSELHLTTGLAANLEEELSCHRSIPPQVR